MIAYMVVWCSLYQPERPTSERYTPILAVVFLLMLVQAYCNATAHENILQHVLKSVMLLVFVFIQSMHCTNPNNLNLG
jgi:hypothetical protein